MSPAGSADYSAADSAAQDLTRVVRRWQQLPLDHALSAVPGVRALVQQLADEVATASGMPHQPVPDLGPAVLMDQLRVMVFDHGAAGLDPVGLARRLTQLRRALP